MNSVSVVTFGFAFLISIGLFNSEIVIYSNTEANHSKYQDTAVKIKSNKRRDASFNPSPEHAEKSHALINSPWHFELRKHLIRWVFAPIRVATHGQTLFPDRLCRHSDGNHYEGKCSAIYFRIFY